jgi:ADP-ribose pyrophosphatase YjhB (NUDIX family)
MRPVELFRFCPKCGVPRAEENFGQITLCCAACGLVFYFNPTVSAAGLVFDATGRVLLVRRAKEPAVGKLGVPGGFIDFGESAEDGLRREVREETGLELANVRFLVSFPNLYHYRDVSYPVVDLYFTADAVNPKSAAALDDTAGVEWWKPADVPDGEIAFDSMRVALAAVRRE